MNDRDDIDKLLDKLKVETWVHLMYYDWIDVCALLETCETALIHRALDEIDRTLASYGDLLRFTYGPLSGENIWIERLAKGEYEPRFKLIRNLDIWGGDSNSEHWIEERMEQVRRAAKTYPGSFAQIALASFRRAGLRQDDVEWLVNLPDLKVVDFSMNEGAALPLAQLPAGLKKLNVMRSNLAGEGLLELLSSRATTTLTSLDLSHNPLGDDGIALLCDAHLPALEILDLTDVQLGDSGAESLAEKIRLPRLKSLQLGHNRISRKGATALQESRELNRAKVINLVNNRTDCQDIASQTTEVVR